MSGGGSGGSTQTVTQKSEPWADQKPFLLKGFEGAQTWLNSNQPNYYPNSTVTPFTNLQERTMADTVARARGGSDALRAGQGAAQDIAGQGVAGLQGAMGDNFTGGPAAATLGNYAAGDFSGTGQGQTLSNAAQGLFGNVAGGNTLGNTAAGAMLGSNPYLDAQYARAAQPLTRAFAEATMPGIDATFARAGRFGGSNAQANAVDTATQNLGRSLTDLGTGLYGGQYGQERQLQQQAAQGLMGGQLGAAQGLLGTQLASTGQVQGAYDTDQARRMQAAQADAAARLQAAGMSPQLAQADYGDLSQLMNIGNIRQGQQQAMLGDDINRWNFEQNRDVNKLGQYMGLVQGGYGSTQQTTQPMYNNKAAGLLGGGLGLASVLPGLIGMF